MDQEQSQEQEIESFAKSREYQEMAIQAEIADGLSIRYKTSGPWKRRKFFKRKLNVKGKDRINFCQVFPSKTHYYSFKHRVEEWPRSFKSKFTMNELLIIFCKMEPSLNWGRRRIRRMTGLSERQVHNVLSKVREIY